MCHQNVKILRKQFNKRKGYNLNPIVKHDTMKA